MQNIIPDMEGALFEGTQEVENEMEKGKIEKESSDEHIKASRGNGRPRADDHPNVLPTSPVFLNALLGRIFYDAAHSPYWSLQLQNSIQRKLNAIKTPPFLELLVVKDLNLGSSFPIIER